MITRTIFDSGNPSSRPIASARPPVRSQPSIQTLA